MKQYYERFRWPEGKKCAAMISVNLEAEYFAKMYYSDIDVDEGGIKLMGANGMKHGLPRILDVLDAYDVKATFFVPADIVNRYPDAVRSVVARGHEIACHGYKHENLAFMSIDEQRQVLKEARRLLSSAAGREIEGFRMPEGEMTNATLQVVKELGFKYSSSLNNDDIPYIREPAGLLELPLNWGLYDLPYFVFNFDPPIPYGQSRIACVDQVLENWKIELQAAREWNTLYVLQIDPQATGEQGRIFMLEAILDEIREANDVWAATGSEIAAYCEKSVFGQQNKRA